LGHALVSRFFAEPYLADGRLIQSVPLEKRSERALYMTCPEGPVSYGSQAFQDWILAQFQ
jgi:LysR family glycine cleavage system transcriptional activator